MALIKCKECGAQISTQAKSCPSCGAIPKKPPTAAWFVGVLGVFVIVGTAIQSNKPEVKKVETTATQTPAPADVDPSPPKQEDLEINAAIAAAKAIRAGTKNPASFKLQSFLIFPGGATCFEYRGTNSFNAVVPARAVFDPKAPMLLTSDRDGNKFVKAWNTICTKPGGRERARGVSMLTDL